MENNENKFDSAKKSGLNLCNIFERWSRGNDEVCKFVAFYSLYTISDAFPKRQVSQMPTCIHPNLRNVTPSL